MPASAACDAYYPQLSALPYGCTSFAAPALAPPKCRILLVLPGGGTARMVLRPHAVLLDVYAAVVTHLRTLSGAKGTRKRQADATHEPTLLAQHNWHAVPEVEVDTSAFMLLRPQPAPARAFDVSELAGLTLEQAGAHPSTRLVVQPAGAGRLRAAMRGALASAAGAGQCVVLRVALPGGGNTPSPILHLRNMQGDRGAALWAKLRPLLQTGWGSSQLLSSSRHVLSAVKDSSSWPHPIAIPLLDYADAALRLGAAALRAQLGAIAVARAAAEDLLQRRDYSYAYGLLYSSGSTLYDHVDNGGTYLVLISLGCAVDFRVADDIIRFESGDALIFNGGTQHKVMHGLRRVHAETCPEGAGLPAELRTARLSLLLRQK